MIELKGSTAEIAEAVKGIAPTFPVHVIQNLWSGEYHFILNGVDAKVLIEEDD